jgi:phosphoribosylformylglycinamidine synthase
MTGAHPLAVVDNLNFGNPEKPEVMWQFKETIEGMSLACESLGIPVIGGNVSFYNETDGKDIHPTPIVGLLGMVEPVPSTLPRLSNAGPDMEVWLFGPTEATNLAGSSFEQVLYGHLGGAPTPPDAETGVAALQLARNLVGKGLPSVMHDIADGGLSVTIAEICMASGIGAEIHVVNWRELFSEDPHRFVSAVEPGSVDACIQLATELAVPATRIGSIGGGSLRFTGAVTATIDLASLNAAWRDAIPSLMDG